MSELKPLVSIVIPVYNGANYLREAIDSALAQTWRDVEVIVINDGSNDGGRTRDVAVSFGDRIRYLEKDNGGVATALNLGIREMRGEFFSWLSHDDVYYPEKIARQVACLDALNGEKAILYSNYDVIDEASRIIGTGIVDAPENPVVSVLGTHVGGCTMLIPRAAFASAGLFNESLRNCQDNELWLRMVTQGYRLQYIPDSLIKSRRHAEQGSRTDSARQAQEARAFYLWALAFIGRQHRLESAASLFTILLKKRLPSPAGRLFRMLIDDRSLGFALSSVGSAVLPLVKAAAANRLAAVPGLRGMVGAIRRRRFGNSSRYWERRYQSGASSGAGSYGRFAEYKADVLNRFVAAHGITRVAEFGCGDGNQLKRFTFAQYLGVDVSSAAVEKCRLLYRDDHSKTFLVDSGLETIAAVRRFEPELAISLDVVYHLVEREVFENYLANLFDASTRYVIIYSTNFDRRYDFPHQVDRKFTDYVASAFRGWKLLEVLANPHKGAETQSDFYIYQKVDQSVGAS